MWTFRLFLLCVLLLQSSLAFSNSKWPKINEIEIEISKKCLSENRVNIENCQKKKINANLDCDLLLDTYNCIKNVLFLCPTESINILYQTSELPIIRKELQTEECRNLYNAVDHVLIGIGREPILDVSIWSTESTKEITESMKKTTELIKETTEPTEVSTEPTEVTSELTKKIISTKETTELIKETTEPTEVSTDPTEGTSEPTKGTTKFMKKTTELIKETTEPTEVSTEPTEGTSELTKKIISTKETTELTKETTEPTKVTTESTKKTTEFTQETTYSEKTTSSEKTTTSDPHLTPTLSSCPAVPLSWLTLHALLALLLAMMYT